MGVGGGAEEGGEGQGGAEAGRAGAGPAGLDGGEGLGEEEGEDGAPDGAEGAAPDQVEPGGPGLPAVRGDRAGGLGELVGDPLAGGDRGVGDGGGDAVSGGEFVAAGEEGGDRAPVAGPPAVGAAGAAGRVLAVPSRLLNRHGAHFPSSLHDSSGRCVLVRSGVPWRANVPLVPRNCAVLEAHRGAVRTPLRSDCRVA